MFALYIAIIKECFAKKKSLNDSQGLVIRIKF